MTNDSLLPSPASLGITVDWSTVGNVIPTHPNEDEVAATTSSDELGSSESSSAAQRRLVDDETAELTWSDVALSIGAAVVRDCRSAVEARLGYTCSAGIAPNKVKLHHIRFEASSCYGRVVDADQIEHMRSDVGKVVQRLEEAERSSASSPFLRSDFLTLLSLLLMHDSLP